MKKRHYNNGDGEFILEPLSDSLVKVTHRDQTGYFGIIKVGCRRAICMHDLDTRLSAFSRH